MISSMVDDIFDFRPASIVETLGLKEPVFASTAAYGHFGRPEFAWERLDRVEAIKQQPGQPQCEGRGEGRTQRPLVLGRPGVLVFDPRTSR